MLSFNRTVTLVHHDQLPDADIYRCTVIPGCSWHGNESIAPSAAGGDAPRMQYTVRIPERRVPATLPQCGDYMVYGTMTACSGPDDLNKRLHFRISQVSDNRRGRTLRHVAVRNV
jgi:hypothetical protein